MYVKIKELSDRTILPRYQTQLASGMDIHACLHWNVRINPGETIAVPTGFAMEIPKGYEAQIRSRSGLAKEGIVVANSPGTVDADYRGQVSVLLHNQSDHPHQIDHGDRIAQMVIAPVLKWQWYPTDELDPTERADGGFGHTGKK